MDAAVLKMCFLLPVKESNPQNPQGRLKSVGFVCCVAFFCVLFWFCIWFFLFYIFFSIILFTLLDLLILLEKTKHENWISVKTR